MLKLRTNLTSYRSPVTRLLVGIGILIIMFYRNDLIRFQNDMLANALTIVCVLLICPCIMVISLSMIEIYYVFRRRCPAKTKIAKSTKAVSVERVIKLVEENSIIELEILCNGRVMKAGASSDFNHNSAVFFDKQYYIDSENYDSIDAFRSAIVSTVGNQTCEIAAIDGCEVKDYNI